MNIYNAATVAKAEGFGMYRREYMPEYKIVPTDDLEGCVIFREVNSDRFGVRWQPRMADLLATDWDVCPLPADELIVKCITKEKTSR